MALFDGQALACQRGVVPVFEGLDFSVAAGEALWLAGPNGSGKSSLLRLMAGLLTPVAGAIRWDGRAIAEDREAHRERLRYLGHLDALKPHLNVGENLIFWAEYWGAPKSRAMAALERVGLARFSAAPARQLSAGQKRRLALARLPLKPASLWLLDEPTAALDAAGIAIFGALVAECRAAGGIVIFSSHETLPVPGAAQLLLAAA
jgi:heme exporter protein A